MKKTEMSAAIATAEVGDWGGTIEADTSVSNFWVFGPETEFPSGWSAISETFSAAFLLKIVFFF